MIDTNSWTRLIGGSSNETVYATRYSSDGFVYAVGVTSGVFDSQSNSGGKDAFLTKYDTNGNKIWSRVFGGILDDYANCLTIGLDGSIYVGGYAGRGFDGQSSIGGDDGFVTKFSANGAKLWTKLIGSPANDYPHALSTGLDGSIYFSGEAAGSIDGQPVKGGRDGFIYKLNPDGVKVWVQLIGSTSTEYVSASSIGADGSLYLIGYAEGNLDGQLAVGGHDGFISKYNSNGLLAWTRLIGGTRNDSAINVSTSPDGFIYVTGTTESNFDGQNLNGGRDAFISKYNSTGNLIWTKFIGGIQEDIGYGVSTGVNRVYVVGTTLGSIDSQPSNGKTDIFVSSFDSNGLYLCTQLLGGSSNDYVIGSTMAAGGNSIFLAGYTEGSLLGQINNGGSDGSITFLPVLGSVGTITNDSFSYFNATSLSDDIYSTNKIDILVEPNLRSESKVTKVADGYWLIQSKSINTNVDTVTGFERISFIDTNLALDISGAAGQVSKILGSVFGPSYVKNPTFAGIGLAYLDIGMSYSDLAKLAADAAGLTTADALVSSLWKNVLGFTATDSNKAPYIKMLNDGMSSADLVVLASDSDLNLQSINISELLTTGLTYIPTSVPAPVKTTTYNLASNQPSINEGSSAVFSVSTTNVTSGIVLNYSLSGISTSDLTNGSLSGTVTIGSNGSGIITIPISADNLTEGPETMYITMGTTTISIIVNDTSITLVGVIPENPDGY